MVVHGVIFCRRSGYSRSRVRSGSPAHTTCRAPRSVSIACLSLERCLFLVNTGHQCGLVTPTQMVSSARIDSGSDKEHKGADPITVQSFFSIDVTRVRDSWGIFAGIFVCSLLGLWSWSVSLSGGAQSLSLFGTQM